MKIISTFLLSISILLSFAQDCDNRFQTDLFTTVDVTTVKYGEAVNISGNTQELFMDIYQAQGDTGLNRPVAIFCFGGSFYTGDRTSGELVYFCTELAKKGYVCASIDYRLAASLVDLIYEEKMVKVVFGAVQDGKAAIRYFRQDADTDNLYNIDTNSIFIGGTSAGGILAINLAYVDDVNQLPSTWQTWADEIGGIEGNSGNPGYCSYVNGVFAFAGAVGDTTYIEENDPPFYGCHATGDQTVLFEYGPPLNGFAPVSLYGSSLIEARMNNLGVYNSVDVYTGSNHPPLNTNTRLQDTKDHLAAFMYNTLECNSSNQKLATQKDCSTFGEEPTALRQGNPKNLWSIYPNPAQNVVRIDNVAGFDEVAIFDALGRQVFKTALNNQDEVVISLASFTKGLYFVQVKAAGQVQKEVLMVD